MHARVDLVLRRSRTPPSRRPVSSPDSLSQATPSSPPARWLAFTASKPQRALSASRSASRRASILALSSRTSSSCAAIGSTDVATASCMICAMRARPGRRCAGSAAAVGAQSREKQPSLPCPCLAPLQRTSQPLTLRVRARERERESPRKRRLELLRIIESRRYLISAKEEA